MIRRELGLFVITFGLLLSVSERTIAQEATEKCSFTEVYRSTGWAVPGLSGAKDKLLSDVGSSSSTDAGTVRATVQGFPGIILTEMVPGQSGDLMLPYCAAYPKGRLIIESAVPIRVSRLWRVEFQGKVFAYVVDYNSSETPGVISGTGEVMFLDLDGRGLFTIARKGLFTKELEIPSWVKK